MKEPLLILLLITLSGCSILGSGEDDDGPPRTIAFSSNEDGKYQIYSMREDGSGKKQLTDGDYNSTNPAWSPNGERIAYASTKDAPYGSQTLWIMDADGSNKKPLVEHPSTGRAMFGDHPSWSPDGTEIAFDLCLTCERGSNNYDIFVADLQSGAIDTLISHFGLDMYPKWSADGTLLTFVSDRNSGDNYGADIYSIERGNGKINRLTNTGNAGRLVWRSEGAFFFWSHNSLYHSSLNDTTATKLNVELPQEIGFRSLDSGDGVNVLLHTFSYDEPRQDHSLQIFNSSSQKIQKIHTAPRISGGTWKKRD